MSTAWSTVEHAEEHETISESFDIENGASGSVVLRTAWAQRWALVNDVVGGRRPFVGISGPNIPQAYSATIRPVPTEYTVGSQIIYQHALVTINYNNKIKDLYAESLEPNAEFITLDYARFRWGAANGDKILEGEAPGKLRRSLSIVCTSYGVESPNIALISLVGCCNKDPYNSALLGFTFDPETLLYVPPNMSRTVKSNGTPGWTITKKFMFKPETWNKFWRAKANGGKGEFQKLWDVAGTSAYESYPPEDLSPVLGS